ncbi:hypothetical protein RCS94_05935 [Orbaceae bacterium ac157xtp]
MDNPYRSGNAIHEKNTTLKQTETTALPSILCAKNNLNRQLQTTDSKGITFIKELQILNHRYIIKYITH